MIDRLKHGHPRKAGGEQRNKSNKPKNPAATDNSGTKTMKTTSSTTTREEQARKAWHDLGDAWIEIMEDLDRI